MKTNKIIYWIITGIFCLMMLASGGMFLFNSEEVFSTVIQPLGFPMWFVYFNGVAKILGVVALIFASGTLKNLAYFGFFLDFVAAITLHTLAADGNWFNPVVPLALAFASYFLWKKMQ